MQADILGENRRQLDAVDDSRVRPPALRLKSARAKGDVAKLAQAARAEAAEAAKAKGTIDDSPLPCLACPVFPTVKVGADPQGAAQPIGGQALPCQMELLHPRHSTCPNAPHLL